MRKFVKFLTILLNFLFFGLVSVSAQVGNIENPIGDDDIFGSINRLTGYIQPLIAVVFLFVIVYGGFTRMTAAGDPEKEKKSNAILTAGIVGFIIIVLAPVIVEIIGNLIGVQDGILG